MKVLGINTGTSLDAVDLCLVDWQDVNNPKAFEILASKSYPFVPEVKKLIDRLIRRQEGSLQMISDLNFSYTEFIAAKVAEFKAEFSDLEIEVIGFHGQTIFHSTHSTWQLGDGSVLANLTGIHTVSDFRKADMSVGGCGAPLISYLDDQLLRSDTENLATLNLGGIANITVMIKDQPTIAYDTGPGNTLIDVLCAKLFHTPFDKNGDIANNGKINENFVHQIIKNQDYFQLEPPKASGREYFNQKFADKFLDLGNKSNIISSVSYLTVKSISIELAKYPIEKVLVSGGGVNNKFIMDKLKVENPTINFTNHDEFNIESQFKEAVLFSLLAFTSYNKVPNNIPSSTGASKEVILGKITYVN
jgi:anhydro-N-acetylmuramic acid kinase